MGKDELARLIGNNVRYYRMKQRMTQNELAQIVGINASAITRIEGGTRMMSITVLRDVATALSISTDALLFDPCTPAHLQNILMLLKMRRDVKALLLGAFRHFWPHFLWVQITALSTVSTR